MSHHATRQSAGSPAARARARALPVIATVSMLFSASAAMAQITTTTTTVTDTVNRLTITVSSGVLTIGDTVLMPDSTSTQEELPGLGHKFELLGVMLQDTDPENAAGNSGSSGGGGGGNETISATTTPTTIALAYRDLPPGIKITALTNQLGLKYFFVSPRTCFGGSPRITLLIDGDGDGEFDFAAHGHVNPGGNYTACAMDKWKYEDLTDDLPRWEVTGASVPGIIPNVYMPWKPFAAAIVAALPNHKVRAGFLLDGESCQFAPSPVTCGKAYYDLVTIENRTLEIWQDTVRH